MKKLKNLLKREKGVTTVEWLIIIAAVAVIATLAVSVLKPRINALVKNAAEQIGEETVTDEELRGMAGQSE